MTMTTIIERDSPPHPSLLDRITAVFFCFHDKIL